MTVELFECAYIELQPSGDYVRHVASFTLTAPFGDFVVLMMSPSSMEVERQAEQDFGVVLDLMIHDIGIVLQLANSPVERIDAVGVSVVTKTEDIANARIAFKNGCVANLSASRVSLKKNREIRVFQTGGYLSIDFMGQKGHTVRVDPTAEGGFAKEEIPIEKGEPLAIELASFTACVRDRKSPKVSGELGRTALAVAIQITEQIRAGMARK